MKIAIIIVILIVLAGSIGGYYYWRNLDNDTIEATPEDTSLYLDPQDNPQTIRPPYVLGDEIAPPPIPAPSKLYEYKAMHFRMEIPGDWVIRQFSDEVLITTAEKTLYSIQVYPARGNDMPALKTYLMSRPNIHAVSDSSFAAMPAFVFEIDGVYGHGYAFIDKERLYYLLGSGIEDSEISRTFKTF